MSTGGKAPRREIGEKAARKTTKARTTKQDKREKQFIGSISSGWISLNRYSKKYWMTAGEKEIEGIESYFEPFFAPQQSFGASKDPIAYFLQYWPLVGASRALTVSSPKRAKGGKKIFHLRANRYPGWHISIAQVQIIRDITDLKAYQETICFLSFSTVWMCVNSFVPRTLWKGAIVNLVE